MDGLECSEIRKNKLERTLRIDSEFYSKEALVSTALICKSNHAPLTKFVDVSDGNHAGISDKFVDKGIPYYRGQDAGTFFIENCTPICIDKDTFNLPVMHRSHLKKNDVLLSIVGTIGSLSLVYSNRDATCSCKLAILRPKEVDTAEVLAVLLSSKYGQLQIKRFIRGAIQKGLILEDMDQLVLPCFESKFRDKIRSMVIAAFNDQENAVKSYELARSFLYKQLKFDSLVTSQASISEKVFSKSFGKTGRLDAEYYQPKYESYTTALKTKDTVQSLCNLYDKNFMPNDNSEYRYIELANVGTSGEISGVGPQIGNDLPTRARRILKKGQVIISSIEGSLQSCALITDELNGALCSNGFYVLDSDCINSETLLVLFKSEPIQALMKQRCSGTILMSINKDEFLSMPLPRISASVQQKIAIKVQESFALRKRSNQLLEYAKQAVEMAIEQGEDAALEWLNEKGSMSNANI